MNIPRAIATRVKANFLLPDRTSEYERMLTYFADTGFLSLTIRDLAHFLQEGRSLPPRFFVMKHDIDTDPGYVDSWLASERKFGFRATYYFRLRTLDLAAMGRVEAAGSEASYHFEELATVLKRRAVPLGPIPKETIRDAQAEFEENFSRLQRLCAWKLETVASHGDFMNRKFRTPNSKILEDLSLRDRLGIIAEAYDERIVNCFEVRFIDNMGAHLWRPTTEPDPESAAAHGKTSLQILTHPRQWRGHPRESLREDADRMVSSILHEARIPAGRFVDYVNRRSRLVSTSGNAHA
jgi:hypothetical protein